MAWKNVIARAAPLLGSLLAGPLGASAIQLLGKTLLDNEKATERDIENALANLTPAQLIALKQIEAELQVRFSQIALNQKKLIAEDINSARMHEIQVRDKIPAVLAILLTVGFFSILLSIMFFHIKTESIHIIDVMLGALGTAWISCITYYFGSSHDLRAKNHLLSQQQNQ